jgi:penicillin-binding protein 1A
VTWRALRLVNLVVLVFAAAASGTVLGMYSSISDVIPRMRELVDLRPKGPTRLLAADGQLLARVSWEDRDFAPITEIPRDLQEGIVAIEDSRFYEHVGLDPRGILRAVWANVRERRLAEGGSTITQQLVRNLYLSPRKTFSRKLQEALLALELERKYSKEEILELYLNQIYFGERAYGAKVAAKAYFNKPLAKLNLGECALLAGLPGRPSAYSPYRNPELALNRRDQVLRRMVRLGAITPEEAEGAGENPLKLGVRPRPVAHGEWKAPYFVNYVLEQVKDRYGDEAIYRGGLTIQTTLNLGMQQEAEKALIKGVEAARSRRVSQGSLVAIDPATGAIKAMVGGVDFAKSEFNRVTQARRQPGSAFKPFVYLAAVEQGFGPETIVHDSPVDLPGAGGRRWRPTNYDGGYLGPIPMRKALYLSRNCATVNLMQQVGVKAVIAVAKRMGIEQELDPYLSLALGSTAVTPFEMATAFGVFATGGIRAQPHGIRRILDFRGHVLEEYQPKVWRVLTRETAATMTDMLSDVVRRGTAARAAGWVLKHFPAAGKTGTTSDFKDAWFVGFSPELVCAVWVGNDDSSPMARRTAGATVPTPIWAKFMVEAVPTMKQAREQAEARLAAAEPVFETPEGAAAGAERPGPEERTERPETEPSRAKPRIVTRTLCADSGLLATPRCPNKVQMSYNLDEGQEPPRRVCTLHEAKPPPRRSLFPSRSSARPAGADERVTRNICARSGKLASIYCPSVAIHTFDAERAPTEVCTLCRPREAR